MEIILLVIVGFVLLLIVLFSAVSITANRITAPLKQVDEKISQLEARIDKLEHHNKR